MIDPRHDTERMTGCFDGFSIDAEAGLCQVDGKTLLRLRLHISLPELPPCVARHTCPYRGTIDVT